MESEPGRVRGLAANECAPGAWASTAPLSATRAGGFRLSGFTTHPIRAPGR
jgi:hypothetical protein